MGADTLGFQYPINKSNDKIQTVNSFFLNKFQKYRSNMPILNPLFSSNMSVFVPDCTVHFFIQEKRIQTSSSFENNQEE